MSGDDFRGARWYAVRPAANRKPATYRCPLCGGMLPALSEHMLVYPEGDASRRRHAHSACVMSARKQGRLPLREEVEPRPAGLLAKLLRRG
ncbi:MAG: hypothetical protein ACM31K_04855 [Solirubrobacterales bacterium]